METLLERVVSLDQELTGSGRYRKTVQYSSLVLDLETQRWYWNKNDLHGGPLEYLLLVRRIPEYQAKEIIQELSSLGTNELSLKSKEIIVPNEKLVDIFWKNGINDRDYWYRRCLSDSTIDRFKLGKYDGFWTLPIYMNGHFMNFQCRTDTPEKKIRPWYRGVGPLLFNSSVLPIVDRVFITEGPVDAILLSQYGFPSVSHTGGASGWNPDWFPYFKNQKIIYYVADNDIAGYTAALKISNSLGKYRIKIVSFEEYPIKTDFVSFIRDGGTIETFKYLVERATSFFEIGEIRDRVSKREIGEAKYMEGV